MLAERAQLKIVEWDPDSRKPVTKTVWVEKNTRLILHDKDTYEISWLLT